MTLQELDEQRKKQAEAATALQAPPVQAVNPKAPSAAPKLPDDMVQSGSVVDDGAPQMSDYNFNQNFYRTYFEAPISAEEEERRKRGAAAASAVGHLGNVLSAFSNLAFAGEAPSQTLPTAPTPDFLSFSDRLRQQRQQYGAGMLSAINMDRRAYNDYLNRLFQQQQAERQEEWNRRNYERMVAKDNAQIEQWKKQNEIAEERLKQDTKAQASLDRYRNTMISQRGTSGRGGSRSDSPIVLNTPNGYISLDMDKVNNATLSQLYSMLPQGIKERYDMVIQQNPKDAASLYLSALGEGASQSTDIADYLYNSGIGMYVKNPPLGVFNATIPEFILNPGKYFPGSEQAQKGYSLGLWNNSPSSSDKNKDTKDLTNL